MDEFLEDLKSGEIQFRDRWQFELKSEFLPTNKSAENTYIQEFYFFIPNSLRISPETYSKEKFYNDLTHLIRYKTPVLSLEVLCDENHPASPFHTIKAKPSEKELQYEMKLIGNIFRSALRTQVQNILSFTLPPFQEIKELCQSIKNFRQTSQKAFNRFDFDQLKEAKITLNYLNEFIGNSINYYLTGLLDQLSLHHSPLPKEIETYLSQAIIEEKRHEISMEISKHPKKNEEILYRAGLLNAYFLDTLALHVDRASMQERYGALISSFAAGIAMLVYLLLFVWQGNWFIINSLPFIIITVGAYILKDRLKEGLKSISYRQVLMYFSDYRTHIRSPQEKIIGELKESFTFVDENRIPEEIRKVRNLEFHAILKELKRQEQVIYFKRIVVLYPSLNKSSKRLNAINISLRYNLKDFLEKASDPYHTYTTFDSKTKTLQKLRLPKVYHLNVIMKNTFQQQGQKPEIELKKFRLILDKNGIKNIESIKT